MNLSTPQRRCRLTGLLFLLLGGGFVTGCSREYERADLGLDSPQATALSEMLRTLRDATDDQVEALAEPQIASGLPEEQRRAMAKSITRLARSDSLEVVSLDRFGKQIYRLGVRLSGPQESQDVALLVVESQGKFYWAKIDGG